VDLHRFGLEPAAAARGERRRFGPFGKLQHLAVECARSVLPPAGIANCT
jgi:hypothetical protein